MLSDEGGSVMEDNANGQIAEARDADLDQSIVVDFTTSLPKLVLASASPRRADILRAAGWDFEILPANADESLRVGEDAVRYVERVALDKARAIAPQFPGGMVVGADTTVVIDGQILGKPQNMAEARKMLRALEDRWHQVLTGIAVMNCSSAQSAVAHEVTQVKFATMTDAEIDWYATTGEPLDKAGAYGIQGLGARFIERVEGDYLNVVGLPLRLLYRLVRSIG
jgi:septum formation protein